MKREHLPSMTLHQIRQSSHWKLLSETDKLAIFAPYAPQHGEMPVVDLTQVVCYNKRLPDNPPASIARA